MVTLPSRALPIVLAALALPLLLAAVPAPAALAGGFANQVPCQLDPALCPDLIVDPKRMRDSLRTETRDFAANSCSVVEGHAPAGPQRLLRWTFTTPNIGTADLIVGSPAAHPEWFVYHPCHRHYHFREYADYRLWTQAGYAQWAALRATTPFTVTSEELLAANPAVASQQVAGNKNGFCVIDLIDYSEGLMPDNWRSCGNQGISVGWADEYYWGLDGQWIVTTGLPSGDYVLENEVNAEHLYAELDYANNGWAVPVKL